MADALFDTTVFIDYYRGDAGARSLLESVIGGTITASYSALTAFELWMGISSREEEIDYVAIMEFLEEAALSGSMARTAAGSLRGLSPGRAEALFRDALIAATAAERGETIYTRNVRDFKRLYPNVQSY